MPNILKYTLQISLHNGLIVVCTCYIRPISSISTLQNWQCFRKYVIYPRHILEFSSDIQKSTKKEVKAVLKRLSNLLLSTWKMCSGINFNQILRP